MGTFRNALNQIQANLLNNRFFDWPYIPYWTIDRFTVTLSSKRPLTTDLYLTLALLVSRTRRLPWPWDAHSRQLQGKVVVFFYLQVLSQRKFCIYHLKTEVAVQRGKGRGGWTHPSLEFYWLGIVLLDNNICVGNWHRKVVYVLNEIQFDIC